MLFTRAESFSASDAVYGRVAFVLPELKWQSTIQVAQRQDAVLWMADCALCVPQPMEYMANRRARHEKSVQQLDNSIYLLIIEFVCCGSVLLGQHRFIFICSRSFQLKIVPYEHRTVHAHRNPTRYTAPNWKMVDLRHNVNSMTVQKW